MFRQVKIGHGSVGAIDLHLKLMLLQTCLFKQIEKKAEHDGVEDCINDIEADLCIHLNVRASCDLHHHKTDC